ncbi:MAG: flagellar biosynthesis anti-sigma factor FlgM [Planctomycetes bacterium]|nr:flagellar biosynthesis anti-sigma factor FlgM [Planctomycetota bacterium]
MEINKTGGVTGPARIEGKRLEAPARIEDSTPKGVTDKVQISEEAQLLSRLRDVPEMRMDRVAELKRQIESGEYETTDKLRVAVDRFLEEIDGK